MRWENVYRLLVAIHAWILVMEFTLLHTANSVNTGTVPSAVQQTMISESSLQQANTQVYELVLNQSLNVLSVNVLGSDSFSMTDLVVHSTGPVAAGSYSLTIVLQIEGNPYLSYVSLIVNVMPEASRACNLQLFGECGQYCVLDNSTFGYSCACAEGYILQQDGVTCLTFDPFPSLLVATNSGVSDLNLLTRQNTQIGLSGPVDFVDYLYDDRVVFYADNSRHAIVSVTLESAQEAVVWNYTQETVSGLAINWVNRSVLYATSDKIMEVIIQTKQNNVILSSLDRPSQLTFHANSEQEMLFWIEGQRHIRRSVLNGDEAESVTSVSSEIVDLSVDVVNEEVYWVTSEGNVCYSPFTGNYSRCFSCCDGVVPSALSVFEVFVYVSLKASNSVVQIHKLGGEVSSAHVVYGNIVQPGDVIIYHPLKQPFGLKGVTDCSQCQQLCLVEASSVACDCSPGFRLSSDGYCYIDEISDIVLAQSVQEGEFSFNSVIKVASTGRQLERLVDSSLGPQATPKTGVVYAMDYDSDNNLVFYGDRDTSTLWKVSLNRLHGGQDNRQLVLSGVYAWDIAFDWINQNIYWSDDRNGTIGSASISTDSTVTNLANGLDHPRGLAVDPFNRLMYWVEMGNKSIWRYSLDTQTKQLLIGDLSEPSDLVIDYQSNLLYWSELSGKIGRMSLSGTNHQVIYNDPSQRPFKLTLYKEFLLWIDNQRGNFNIINSQDLNIIGDIPVVPAINMGFSVLSGILVVGNNRQFSPGNYSCVQNTLGCSHYCNLDELGNTFCSCPQTYSMSDGTTCSYEGVCPICSGGGLCEVQSSNVSCACPPGYRGNACDQFCEEGMFGERCGQQCMCLNEGECNPVNGSCTCVRGYEGTTCAQAVCADGCQNGGTCIAPDTCTCQETYVGPTCEQRVCTSDYCFNGGTCTEDFGVELSCKCPSFTSGARCQFVDTIIEFQGGERLGVAVGVPFGLVFGIVLVAVVVGIGVFYYVRCIPHRKTNPMESQEGVPPTVHIPEVVSKAESSTNDCTNVGNNEQDCSYHTYVHT